jgi:hypothetical protein
MAKKKTTSKPKQKKLISPFQFILILTILAAFYAYKNPSVLKALPFDTSKLNLPQSTASSSADLTATANNLYSKATDYFLQFADNTNLPTKFTDLPEEVIVDQVVDSFTAEVKNLPNKQVKRIKTQICEDIISEAVATMSAR